MDGPKREKPRPPFRDFYRSTWAFSHGPVYGRYKNMESIIICKDGRVFREKYYDAYRVIMYVFPLLVVISPLVSYFLPWPDTTGTMKAAESNTLYDEYHSTQRLVSLIFALVLLVAYFIGLPVIRYVWNRFKLIHEDDPASRMELNNEFFEL